MPCFVGIVTTHHFPIISSIVLVDLSSKRNAIINDLCCDKSSDLCCYCFGYYVHIVCLQQHGMRPCDFFCISSNLMLTYSKNRICGLDFE